MKLRVEYLVSTGNVFQYAVAEVAEQVLMMRKKARVNQMTIMWNYLWF